MFENNQLSLPLAYILVLVLCLSSLVLFFSKRWLERELYGKPGLLFYGLFGLMLLVDFVWSLMEYAGYRFRSVAFFANLFWYGAFLAIAYRWLEVCLRNLSAERFKRLVPRPVRMLPAILTGAFAASSWWTGWLIDTTPEGCYVRGPYLWVAYAVAFAYLFATAAVCVVKGLTSREVTKRRFAYSLLMSTGPLILTAYLQYETGFAFFFIGVIITTAIHDFDAQRKAVEMLVAADKARHDALTKVSHGIRTPLNAIVGLAELLQDEQSEEARRRMQAEIVTGSRVLMQLVNDVLDLSTLEAGKPTPPGEAGRVPALTIGSLGADSTAGSRRILLVDDAPLNLKVMSAMLKKLGETDVTLAHDGDEALALLKAAPERYDLVLTDLQMPKMDGDALVREIRADARLSRLLVYVITADIQAQADCAAAGFDGIVIKPVTLAKLGEIVRRQPASRSDLV